MLVARAQRDLVLVSISREGDSRARITRITRERSFKADRLSREPAAECSCGFCATISDIGRCDVRYGGARL